MISPQRGQGQRIGNPCLRSQLAEWCEVRMSATSRREQIEAMLAEMPNDVELRYMLAMEHASAGDDLAAVRCFHELIALRSDYAPAYHQAGRTLQRLNRTAEARAILQAGIPVAQRVGNQHAAGEMMELLQSMDEAQG